MEWSKKTAVPTVLWNIFYTLCLWCFPHKSHFSKVYDTDTFSCSTQQDKVKTTTCNISLSLFHKTYFSATWIFQSCSLSPGAFPGDCTSSREAAGTNSRGGRIPGQEVHDFRTSWCLARKAPQSHSSVRVSLKDVEGEWRCYRVLPDSHFKRIANVSWVCCMWKSHLLFLV